MSRLYKRKNSPYWYYTEGTGTDRVQRSTGTADKRIARIIQTKWDQERILRKHGIAPQNKHLAEVILEYKKLIIQRKSHAWATRQIQHLNNFSRFAGDPKITDITTRHIDQYISHRMNNGISNKTVRDEVATVTKLFEFAIGNDWTRKNPCRTAMLPERIAKNPRKDIPFNIVIQAIDRAVHERDRILWTILLYTGLRAGDAGNLKPENFKNGFIDLEPEKTSRYKTKVLIPIHPKLKQIGINNLVAVMPKPGYRNGSLQRFQRILRDIGYTEHADLHSIRHSLATRLAETGLPPEYIRLVVGHKKTEMTMQYTHVVDLIKTAFEKI